MKPKPERARKNRTFRYCRRIFVTAKCKGLKNIIIHTDGACQGNPGPGGWAAVLRYNDRQRQISGGEPATTNNRMEMQAAIAALDALKEPCAVTLFTDSEYLKNGITSWVRGWKARGWLTKDKKPVKNQDLWRQLDQLTARHQVIWQWVKGHAGHSDNELCDELARGEISKLRKKFTKSQITEQVAQFKAGAQALPLLPDNSLPLGR